MDKNVILAIALLLPIVTACANTCPTTFKKTNTNYLISKDAPGWKSSQPLSAHTSINVKDFGGAIYSPAQKRLACVYRSSKGYWVSMVSHIHKGFQINRHILNDQHQKVAWHWDKTHQDFACGRPDVTKRDTCEFTVND